MTSHENAVSILLLLLAACDGSSVADDASRADAGARPDATSGPNDAGGLDGAASDDAAHVDPSCLVDVPVAVGATRVTLPCAGTYRLVGLAHGPDDGNNGFFVDLDADPTGDATRIWDLDVSAMPTEQDVSWRGSCDHTCAEHDPKLFELSAGEHTLYVITRPDEPGSTISRMRFVPARLEVDAGMPGLDGGVASPDATVTGPDASVTTDAGTLDGTGAHHYVRTTASGARNGTSWTDAWGPSELAASWGRVEPGDTVWIAGGEYTGGLTVDAEGTAGAPVLVRRPLATDAVPTSAPGWSASFDSRAVFTSSRALRAGCTHCVIDGRIDMGMRFVASNSGGLPTSADVTGADHLTLQFVDLVGPNAVDHPDGSSCGESIVDFAGDNSGLMIGYGYSPNPGADDVVIRASRIRGHVDEIWFAGARNITIEGNRLYDNGARNSATWHGNLMIVNGSDGIVFRDNEVFNWQVEGLYPWGSPSRNWTVVGNLFHDGMGRSTHRFLEIRSYSGSVTHGPFRVYNNTVVNCWASITRGDTTVFWSADSEARNNLFWNTGGAGYLPPIADHNFSDGSAGAGAGSISRGSDPFVDLAGGDYRIRTEVSPSLPRDRGVDLGAPYATDRYGSARGADGAWDIGAHEAR